MKLKNVASGFLTTCVLAGVGFVSYTEVQAREKELECLALNIYHESRGEPVIGQIAVAQVTMNRVNHEYFPDTVCGVVWQDRQFSWTHDGYSDTPGDKDLYERALNIAGTVISGQEDDPTAGALFYHADRVNPSWNRKMDFYTQISVHKFYHWDGDWNND